MFSQHNQRPTILVVDDDPASLTLLQAALAELGRIITVATGEEALEQAVAVQPDVILLDIELPGISGLEVCRKLKANAPTRDISVIFVTAHHEQELEGLSLTMGGIDFLTKPINFNTAALRVKNHLQLQTHRRALETSRRDMELLMAQIPVGVSYWDTQWRNLYSNDTYGHWFGRDPATLRGQSLDSSLPPSLVEEIKAVASSHDRDFSQFESYYQSQAGQKRHVQATVSADVQQGQRKGHLVTIMDVSTLEEAKQRLDSEREKFRVTLNSIGDAVIAVDMERHITFMNPIAERMTGWCHNDAVGESIDTVMHLQDATSRQAMRNPLDYALSENRIVAMAMNAQLTGMHGEIYRVEDSAAPIHDAQGQVIGGIIVFHDVSETIAMSMKMNQLAYHDQLTDLPNRVLLQDRANRALQIARQSQGRTVFFLIDIDHFKYLNETLGHNTGDELIRILAKRLNSVIDIKSTLARIGGDEFAIVVHHIDSLEEIAALCSRIADAFKSPFQIEGTAYNTTASIGVSIYPDDAQSLDELMRHADAALYRAKFEGRDRYCFFSPEMESHVFSRHELEQLLRDALKNRRLEVHYQPKVRTADRSCSGAEALARLYDSDGAPVAPVEFIGLAEQTGLIVELGAQVLETACRDAISWIDADPDFIISVNVAAGQLCSDEFYDTVLDILARTGVQASNLQLEVTESEVMTDLEKCERVLELLKDAGVSIALDDFGTGYSSLAYLKRLNIDTLKIDKSFIADMTTNSNDRDIVRAVVKLGDSMNLHLVAEGVETENQERELLEMGCLTCQGFLYSPAVKKDQFDQLLASAPFKSARSASGTVEAPG